MSRLALLFSDGSILALPEGADVDMALREAEEHDMGDEPDSSRTKVVRLELEIVEVLN